MNIVIGTAQFGRNYGVANKSGIVLEKEVLKIFKYANKNGINFVDSGNDYGDSESVLGRCKEKSIKLNIITKQYFKDEREYGIDNFKKSLNKLKADSVFCVLLHNINHIKSDNVFKRVEKIKDEGLAKLIGVSVNNVFEAIHILKNRKIDLIQFPCNVLNQKFITSGVFSFCKDSGILLQARSIFLQGLLAQKLNEMDKYFLKFSPELLKIEDIASLNKIDKYRLAVEYIKFINPDFVTVGVNSKNHLKDFVKIINKQKININFELLKSDNEGLINPGKWPVGGWL